MSCFYCGETRLHFPIGGAATQWIKEVPIEQANKLLTDYPKDFEIYEAPKEVIEEVIKEEIVEEKEPEQDKKDKPVNNSKTINIIIGEEPISSSPIPFTDIQEIFRDPIEKNKPERKRKRGS